MTINILEFLEDTAKIFPEKNAFVFGDERISYAELLSYSQLMGYQINHMIGKHKPILILLGKGLNEIISIYGALYSGGIFSVVDPKIAEDRLSAMIDNLNPGMIITSEEYYDSFCNLYQNQNIILYSQLIENKKHQSNDIVVDYLNNKVRQNWIDEYPAGIFFTSGSTGIPKAVVISHRALINSISGFHKIFDISSDDNFSFVFNCSAIISIYDIFASVCKGATAYLATKTELSFPSLFIDYLNKNKITICNAIFSTYTTIVESNVFKKVLPKYLRYIIFGGEGSTYKTIIRWKQYLPDITYVHTYGATELTGMAAYYMIPDDCDNNQLTTVPLEYNFPNMNLIILNDDKEIAKPNDIGMVYITGADLALGYWNDMDLTDKKMVQSPLQNRYKEIYYITGDLGYYDDNGKITIVGRKDNQISHLGYRIELEDIESNINNIDTIQSCCCLYDDENKNIVCIYKGDIDEKSLLNELKLRLPRYMIPRIYHQTDTMFFNSNRKIDREKMKSVFIHQEK